jgi:hypothetical protein
VTVTSKSQESAPAVQVTVVVPTGKNEPDAWVHVAPAGAAYETFAPQAPASFETVMSSGQAMVHGGGGGASAATVKLYCVRLQPHDGSYATTRQLPVMLVVPEPMQLGRISAFVAGSVNVYENGSAVMYTVVKSGASGMNVHSFTLPPAASSRCCSGLNDRPPEARISIVSPGAKCERRFPHMSYVRMPT